MEKTELKIRPSIDQNSKLHSSYAQFDKLLTEWRKKELPEEIVKFIDNKIDQINSVMDSEKELRKQKNLPIGRFLNFFNFQLLR